ncbi:MAG: ABC transporter permease [Alphaproteobacteria bacterium]|nr:ABC transporter permease [Alphaproteobacteria bacterium]
MSLLDRKLGRDLRALRGQVLTIALVVAAGVAVFVASVSTFYTLRTTIERFYADTRFPQAFATVKRAPLSVVAAIAEIPGIAAVQPRIVRDVILDWPASPLPVSARIVSLAGAGEEGLARLHMRSGAAPAPGDARGAVLNEAFAEANAVLPGAEIRALLNGRLQAFRITGIALSPEYVFAVKPGLPIPDDRLFAVLWIDRAAAEAAFDMKGAFNDLIVTLAPGADAEPVIAELDRLLAPYGSIGAIARRNQPSNRFLEDELNQQRVTSITIPLIFFGVAAFLLNVALGRLVSAQREQIAALKALGFADLPLALHYLKFVLVVVALGVALGIGGGILFGHAMIASYHDFLRLPVLEFSLVPWAAVAGAAISAVTASLGVLASLRGILRLAPAVAMRPLAPQLFARSRIEGLFATAAPHPRRMMLLRGIAGRPARTLLTIIGIACAVPMVVLGLFWRDAIDRMIDVQFALVERGNVGVTFPQPRDRAILRDLAREPGVLAVEGQRVVPVRLRAGHRTYLASVIGLPADSTLRRPHDGMLRPVDVPPDGIMLTRRLAERLGVSAGAAITIEVLEGRQRRREVAVGAIVDEALGMATYMDLDALNRLAGEGAVISAASLYVDPASLPALAGRLKGLPVIEAVAMKAYTLSSFLDKVAGLVLVSAAILTGFAIIIAVGVVYNSARIALQERAWELASLRVLGFTRAEVARMLFGELALKIAIGTPLGLLLAQGIVALLARYSSNESFQIPSVVGARTYLAAILVVTLAAALSAYVVRRRIDRLDLVAALKSRD